MPNSHFAKRCVFQRTGKPTEVLEVESFELPELSDGMVRVAVAAAPINPADLNTLEGTYGVRPDLPAAAGTEGSGVVVGSAHRDFKEGDLVMFVGRSPSWATHVTLSGDQLFALPEGIDMQQAAMLKVNPATAWRMLHDFVSLKPGDWVVQNAGNSGVSRCLSQLARRAELRTISFVRRLELADELKDLGADHVLSDDDDGLAAAKEIMGGKQAALASNSVGGDSALRLMNLLRPGASHVTYGAMGRRPLTVPNGLLIFRDIQIRGLWVSRWLGQASREEIRQTYQELSGLMREGALCQAIDSSYPLEEFAAAFARLESPDRQGKVLFVP